GKDDAPVGDAVERVVPEQRRGFLVSAALADLERPSQAQPPDIRGVDLAQRAIARLAGSGAVAEPFFAGFSGIPKRGVVDETGILRKPEGLASYDREQRCRQELHVWFPPKIRRCAL